MEAPRRNDMGTAKKGDGGIPRYARNDNVKAGAFMAALRRTDMGTSRRTTEGFLALHPGEAQLRVKNRKANLSLLHPGTRGASDQWG